MGRDGGGFPSFQPPPLLSWEARRDGLRPAEALQNLRGWLLTPPIGPDSSATDPHPENRGSKEPHASPAGPPRAHFHICWVTDRGPQQISEVRHLALPSGIPALCPVLSRL